MYDCLDGPNGEVILFWDVFPVRFISFSVRSFRIVFIFD